MYKVILADDQAIFRAGAARVLALESDMRIVAQCDDSTRLASAVMGFRQAVVVFAAGLVRDMPAILTLVAEAGSFALLIAEKGETIVEPVQARAAGRDWARANRAGAGGVCAQGRPGAEDCRARQCDGDAAAGCGGGPGARPADAERDADCGADCAGAEEQGYCAPTEYEGAGDQELSAQYLRQDWRKRPVGAALFTLHHRVLAEAAAKAGTLIVLKSA